MRYVPHSMFLLIQAPASSFMNLWSQLYVVCVAINMVSVRRNLEQRAAIVKGVKSGDMYDGCKLADDQCNSGKKVLSKQNAK
jgi:hypothetical protein